MIAKLLSAAAAAAVLAAPAFAETYLIRNGTVWTGGPDGVVENGAVLVEDGVVAEVGTDISAPEDATVIDAEGGWITPGVISPYTQVGLIEVSAEDSTNDSSAATSLYSAGLDAADGFNPSASSVDVTRIEGVTRIAVAPTPSINIFAGQGFVADTSGDPDSITAGRAFTLVYIGEAGAALAGGSRPAAWRQFRAALSDARTFPARFLAHNEGDALTRVDAQAFGPASRGQQLILIAADRASDLRQIIALREERPELQIAVLGAGEGWIVADELAAADIPVIIDPFSNLPGAFERLGATSKNAERLIEAGVTTAFAHISNAGHQARLVLQSAGNAVANGMAFDDAMAAITTAPAEIFGLEGFGALEAGAVGDVVVWDGDPLEVTSSPTAVLIDGEPQSLESRQTRLRDRYSDLERGELPFAYDR